MKLENAGILIGEQYLIDDNSFAKNEMPNDASKFLSIHNLRFNFDLDNIDIVLGQSPDNRYLFKDKATGAVLPDVFYFLDEEKCNLFYTKMAQLVKDTEIYTLKQMRLQISYQQLFAKVKAEIDDFMNNTQVVNDLIDDYLEKTINIEVI